MCGETVLLGHCVYICRVPHSLAFWFTDMIVYVCCPLSSYVVCVISVCM